jgi:hypothetical protein
MIFTRALREWVCLLSLDVSGDTTKRLLGWITQEPAILSASEVRSLTRQHGAQLRAAEAAEVEELLAHPQRLAEARPQLVTAQTKRRKAAWPKELTAAVEAALAKEPSLPPEGVVAADWERVLEARRAEKEARDAEALRRLGPGIAPDQIVVGADEVLVRKPKKGEFLELRTARVETASGYRYVSGRKGEGFLSLLWVLLLVCGARSALVTRVSDGAYWIREESPGAVCGVGAMGIRVGLAASLEAVPGVDEPDRNGPPDTAAAVPAGNEAAVAGRGGRGAGGTGSVSAADEA